MFAVMTTGQIGAREDTYGNGAYNNQLNETYKKIKEAWQTLSADGQTTVVDSIKEKYPKGANSDSVDLDVILHYIHVASQQVAQAPMPPSTQPASVQGSAPIQNNPSQEDKNATSVNYDPNSKADRLKQAWEQYKKGYITKEKLKQIWQDEGSPSKDGLTRWLGSTDGQTFYNKVK